MDGIACTWLPEGVARLAADEEPKRFTALVSQFVSVAEAASASSELNRWAPIVQWVPLLNKCDPSLARFGHDKPRRLTPAFQSLLRSFLMARKDYDINDVQRLTEALLRVVMGSSSDLEVQVSPVVSSNQNLTSECMLQSRCSRPWLPAVVARGRLTSPPPLPPSAGPLHRLPIPAAAPLPQGPHHSDRVEAAV